MSNQQDMTQDYSLSSHEQDVHRNSTRSLENKYRMKGPVSGFDSSQSKEVSTTAGLAPSHWGRPQRIGSTPAGQLAGTATLKMRPNVVAKATAPPAVFGQWNHYGQSAQVTRVAPVPADVYVHSQSHDAAGTTDASSARASYYDQNLRGMGAHSSSIQAEQRHVEQSGDKGQATRQWPKAKQQEPMLRSAPLKLSSDQQQDLASADVSKPFSAGNESKKTRLSSTRTRPLVSSQRGAANIMGKTDSYSRQYAEKSAQSSRPLGYQPGTLREYGASKTAGYKTLGGTCYYSAWHLWSILAG